MHPKKEIKKVVEAPKGVKSIVRIGVSFLTFIFVTTQIVPTAVTAEPLLTDSTSQPTVTATSPSTSSTTTTSTTTQTSTQFLSSSTTLSSAPDYASNMEIIGENPDYQFDVKLQNFQDPGDPSRTIVSYVVNVKNTQTGQISQIAQGSGSEDPKIVGLGVDPTGRFALFAQRAKFSNPATGTVEDKILFNVKDLQGRFIDQQGVNVPATLDKVEFKVGRVVITLTDGRVVTMNLPFATTSFSNNLAQSPTVTSPNGSYTATQEGSQLVLRNSAGTEIGRITNQADQANTFGVSATNQGIYMYGVQRANAFLLFVPFSNFTQTGVVNIASTLPAEVRFTSSSVVKFVGLGIAEIRGSDFVTRAVNLETKTVIGTVAASNPNFAFQKATDNLGNVSLYLIDLIKNPNQKILVSTTSGSRMNPVIQDVSPDGKLVAVAYREFGPVVGSLSRIVLYRTQDLINGISGVQNGVYTISEANGESIKFENGNIIVETEVRGPNYSVNGTDTMDKTFVISLSTTPPQLLRTTATDYQVDGVTLKTVEKATYYANGKEKTSEKFIYNSSGVKTQRVYKELASDGTLTKRIIDYYYADGRTVRVRQIYTPSTGTCEQRYDSAGRLISNTCKSFSAIVI